MNCPHIEWPDDEAYFRDFFCRANAARVPLSGSLELTRRCNLRCVHCYLGPQEQVRRAAGREMDTAQVTSILDQATEAGCLHLLITGGDPLLRQDFAEIYRHARLAGLDVTVFTNGTLVTEQIVELFQELPPHIVEITLYGATAETYERITDTPGAYRRCLAGIERLRDGGVRVGLKTMLVTLNRHEFAAIEALAADYGARFRFDPLINARLDGDRGPLSLRVAPAEAIGLEFASPKRRQAWLDYGARAADFLPSDRLVQCGAGQTAFHVDAFGNLKPCLMLPWLSYSLHSGTFADGWAALAPIRDAKVNAGNRCAACPQRFYCGYCPGLLALENGDPEIPADYLCALGAERLRATHTHVVERGEVRHGIIAS
jgi:radical SAM protein with 4Fe4S-binding SPASM domain